VRYTPGSTGLLVERVTPGQNRPPHPLQTITQKEDYERRNTQRFEAPQVPHLSDVVVIYEPQALEREYRIPACKLGDQAPQLIKPRYQESSHATKGPSLRDHASHSFGLPSYRLRWQGVGRSCLVHPARPESPE